MRARRLKTVTIIGLIAILALQGLWLSNTYSLIKKNIIEDCDRIFEKAVLEGTSLNFSKIPKGTQIFGAPRNVRYETFPECTYMIESFRGLNIEIQLAQIDSTFRSMLRQGNIISNIYIDRIATKKDSITETTRLGAIPIWGTLKTKTIPIRLDESQALQATLLNPYWTIFQRMALLMIATVIMMVFVIGCIVYQVKIIARQNRIAKKREDFSYAMIHDMKTPLSSIMMAADSLHSGKLDGKPEIKEKFFTIIGSEVEHLLKLTNKVLTLSKLESDKLEMNKTVIQIEPIITGLEEMFSTKTKKKVAFVNELEEKEVYADEEFLKEAISNLMDNAIKYSKDSVEITVSSVCNASYSLIKVHDNGIGISQKDQRRIFNKFERAAAAMKRTKQGGPSGFGLGLNYVYQVMDAHGGEVTVNSMEGEFSEFTLYIPQLIKELQND